MWRCRAHVGDICSMFSRYMSSSLEWFHGNQWSHASAPSHASPVLTCIGPMMRPYRHALFWLLMYTPCMHACGDQLYWPPCSVREYSFCMVSSPTKFMLSQHSIIYIYRSRRVTGWSLWGVVYIYIGAAGLIAMGCTAAVTYPTMHNKFALLWVMGRPTADDLLYIYIELSNNQIKDVTDD